MFEQPKLNQAIGGSRANPAPESPKEKVVVAMENAVDEAAMAKIIRERPLPDPETFEHELERTVRERKDLVMEHVRTLTYDTAAGRESYNYLCIRSKNIAPGDPVVFVRAGIHGDEVAGPLTLMKRLHELADYAADRGVKLWIYPLDNPSGFKHRTRRNCLNDSGSFQDGNNDFMRFEVNTTKGETKITGSPEPGDKIQRWWVASSPALQPLLPGLRLPLETQALHDELPRLPLAQIKVCLDLHQDNMIFEPGTYFYYAPRSADDKAAYAAIAGEVGKLAPMFRDRSIGSGQEFPAKADELGGIDRHDGTLPDLMHHLGVRHCVTVETTGLVELQTAEEINMHWLKAAVDLAAPV